MKLPFKRLFNKILHRKSARERIPKLSRAYSSDLAKNGQTEDLLTAESLNKMVRKGAQTVQDAATRKIPEAKKPPKVRRERKPKVTKISEDLVRPKDKNYLVTEAKIFAIVLQTRLKTLGYYYSSKASANAGINLRTGKPNPVRGKTRLEFVEFERIYPSVDAIYFKVRTQKRAGLFGTGRKSALPHGVRATDLIDEITLFELSVACDRKIVEWHDPTFEHGLWYIMYRTGSIAGLPKAVPYRTLIEEHYPTKPEGLTLIVGVSTGRKVEYFDLDSYPHWLVAGATGSGKSTLVNSLICQILAHSHDTKLCLIDLKRLEFAGYKGLPGVTVVNEPEDALAMLQWALREVHARTRIMEGRAKKITEWNRKMPYHYLCRQVIVIDEFAELVLGDPKLANQVFNICARISALGRAVGVHLIISTQHPSAKIVTTIIKLNMAIRLIGRVQDNTQSMVALGNGEAAKIPEIPGRMIMKANAHDEPIQTPNVLEDDLEEAKKLRLTVFAPPVDTILIDLPKLLDRDEYMNPIVNPDPPKKPRKRVAA